jgi:carboxypeptidase Q
MRTSARRKLNLKTLGPLFALLLSASFGAWSQTALEKAQGAAPAAAFSKELREQLQAVRDAALSSDYAWQQLAHLTENIGPRPAGSPQAQAAAEYVAAEMRKLGLEVHLEPAQVSHWVRGEEKAQLVEYPGQAPETTQRIVLTTISGSSATPAEGITAEVVVVHNFDELTALGRQKVAGKIVLFNVPFDERKALAGMAFEAYGEAVGYRGHGAKAAAELGAAASLVRSVGGADYRLPHTGYSVPAGIPAAALAAEDADLVEHLAAQGRIRMRLTLTPQSLPARHPAPRRARRYGTQSRLRHRSTGGSGRSASSRTAANISTITTAPPIRSTKSIRRICARTGA